MKKVKITEGNKDKIEAVLKEAAGKAKNTATYEDVISSIKEIEKKLLIPKKYLNGVVANVDPWAYWAKNLPNAYKYTPQSVHFAMENIKGVWYFVGATRDYCNKCNIILYLPEVTENKIIENHMFF